MDKRPFAIDKDPITSSSIHNEGPQLRCKKLDLHVCQRAGSTDYPRNTELKSYVVVTNKHSYPGRDPSLC